MAQNTEAAWSDETLSVIGQGAERWPAPYPAMLVIVSSILLWAALIGGLRWLLG